MLYNYKIISQNRRKRSAIIIFLSIKYFIYVSVIVRQAIQITFNYNYRKIRIVEYAKEFFLLCFCWHHQKLIKIDLFESFMKEKVLCLKYRTSGDEAISTHKTIQNAQTNNFQKRLNRSVIYYWQRRHK